MNTIITTIIEEKSEKDKRKNRHTKHTLFSVFTNKRKEKLKQI